jgi:hypothetical protein
MSSQDDPREARGLTPSLTCVAGGSVGHGREGDGWVTFSANDPLASDPRCCVVSNMVHSTAQLLLGVVTVLVAG